MFPKTSTGISRRATKQITPLKVIGQMGLDFFATVKDVSLFCANVLRAILHGIFILLTSPYQIGKYAVKSKDKDIKTLSYLLGGIAIIIVMQLAFPYHKVMAGSMLLYWIVLTEGYGFCKYFSNWYDEAKQKLLEGQE